MTAVSPVAVPRRRSDGACPSSGLRLSAQWAQISASPGPRSSRRISPAGDGGAARGGTGRRFVVDVGLEGGLHRRPAPLGDRFEQHPPALDRAVGEGEAAVHVLGAFRFDRVQRGAQVGQLADRLEGAAGGQQAAEDVGQAALDGGVAEAAQLEHAVDHLDQPGVAAVGVVEVGALDRQVVHRQDAHRADLAVGAAAEVEDQGRRRLVGDVHAVDQHPRFAVVAGDRHRRQERHHRVGGEQSVDQRRLLGHRDQLTGGDVGGDRHHVHRPHRVARVVADLARRALGVRCRTLGAERLAEHPVEVALAEVVGVEGVDQPAAHRVLAGHRVGEVEAGEKALQPGGTEGVARAAPVECAPRRAEDRPDQPA